MPAKIPACVGMTMVGRFPVSFQVLQRLQPENPKTPALRPHESQTMNDWDDLHCFTVLVEKQTLTAAADALGVQHSTVSRRIARLEETLGLRLFDRIGRRYLLTAEGERIRAQAQEIAVGMGSLLRAAREQREEMGEVAVSVPPLAAKSLLMPHFAGFARRHPNIRLVLQSDAHISNLHARQADIALRLVRPVQNDLVTRRLRPVRYRFYARERYLQTRARAEYAFLRLTAVGAHAQWQAEQLAGRRVILACNDFDLIKAAVAAETGIGLLPDFHVRSEDGFVRADLDGTGEQAEFAADMYLVMHEDLRRSPKIRAVADFLAEVLADKPAG